MRWLSRVLEGYRERLHRSRLEEEAPLAVLAASIIVEAGRNPIEVVERLAELDSLPAVSAEASDIIRRALLARRTLPEQVLVESRGAGGLWGRLISTVAFSTMSGVDPRVLFRSLMDSALRDLRSVYRETSRRLQTLAGAANIAFGVMPMMAGLMLAVLSSVLAPTAMLMYTAVNVLAAIFFLAYIDSQVPRMYDFRPVYRRLAVKWLPPALLIFAASALGLLYLPASLVYRSATAVSLGALAFSVPAALEWRRHSRVYDELLMDLPFVLRGVAERVAMGRSPHQALEDILASGGMHPNTGRLLTLIVEEARIHGSLRGAYSRLKKLLPRQWRVGLELLVVLEEAGAGAGAVHVLADSMSLYVDALRDFRRQVSGTKWLAVAVAVLSLVLFKYVSATVLSRLALVSRGLGASPFSMPILFRPEDIPMLEDAVTGSMAVNNVVLAAVSGKVAGWRLGDGFQLMVYMGLASLLSLVLWAF